ncbi:MAG: signal peptidase I [Lachnospiraceae bacterium]|nr:signal peptidase I [Lachnospiraceae bacterium]
MKYFLNTILNVIVWVVIAVLSFLVLSGLLQRTVFKGQETGLFGIGYAVVVSGSMEPALHVNDMIVYQKLDRDEYTEGDIIVFQDKEGTLITHRIQAVRGLELITKGDANPIFDEPITFQNVVGRVVFYVPKVGIAASFLKTPRGLIVSAIVLVMLVLLLFVIGSGRKKSEKKDA